MIVTRAASCTGY